MESGKERKVCFIASSGGHWEELMCLKSVAQKYDAFYVTEEGGQANDASANLDSAMITPELFLAYENERKRLRNTRLQYCKKWI